MTFDAPGSVADGVQIRVRTRDIDRVLGDAASYRIGRDPQADISVSDPRVSWNHAVLRRQDSGWILEDSGSTNGTFVDQQRVSRVTVSGDCSVRLGHPADGPQLRCSLVGTPALVPPQRAVPAGRPPEP